MKAVFVPVIGLMLGATKETSPLAWVEVAAGSSPKLVMAKHLVNAVYCDSTFRVGLMLW
jgi:hypothetical protein